MLFKAALLLAIVAAVSANDVAFRPCTGAQTGVPTPTRVWSDMCSPTICTLERESTFRARAYFSPLEQFSVLNIGVAAHVLGIELPMDIPAGHDNACLFLDPGQSCPVQPGGQYTWALEFPVPDNLPAVPSVNIQSKFWIIFLKRRFNYFFFLFY